MTPKLDLVGMVVEDMASTIAFYRQLGIEFPDGAEGEGHVEIVLGGGLRLAWDTAEVIRSFDPEWTPLKGRGQRYATVRDPDGYGIDIFAPLPAG